jgi:hypothetical protein
VGLDRQVHATGLENREDGYHPVQIALRHHRHDVFSAQPLRQHRSGKAVGAGVELPVRKAAAGAHGGDALGMRPRPLLKQLVRPGVRQQTPPPRQTFELKVKFLCGQQALPSMFGIRIGGHQLQRREVIAGDPGSAVRIKHLGLVPQSQYRLVASLRNPEPQHGVLAEVAVPTSRVENSLKCRFGHA